MTDKSAKPVPRGRGRPAKSEADHAAMLDHILEATAATYGETGYHGLSVRAILLKAELSRPTFYRYFNNVEDPAREVVVRAHRDLLSQLTIQIPRKMPITEKMDQAIDLYLEWGKRVGPMLRPFYSELHDPLSPVSQLRQDVLKRIADFYIKIMDESGHPTQNRLLVDMMITGIEFLGYRFHLETRRDAKSLRMTKDAMLRLMACTFARPEDWLRMLRRKSLID